MIHVDALSRYPLPCNMLIDELEESIIVRIRKAQREDANQRNIYALAVKGQCDDYVVRGDLLFRENKGDIQLVVPKCLQSQITRYVHRNGHFAVEKNRGAYKTKLSVSRHA
ncbi:unnamed protein product [Lasius platythorax]|uniref:Integrase zinc-binding domain-containing protein n=1 Tax=Lasius platythorax TaxID=488582 RepID=A0AAV2MVZ6_9HYME